MQNIIIEEPYEFVPPDHGTFWASVIQKFRLYFPYLRRKHGIVDYECRHTERLRASLDAGHGILLTPNHCRMADPITMGFLAREVGTHVFAMASWHLFKQNWRLSWAIRKMGGFSINREGVDRKAINTAVDVVTRAERPLIVFPEGVVTRTNDVVHALLDGIAFMARAAAKKRAKQDPPGKVVIHPVGIKYLFQGDIYESVDPVLTEIEHRFSWLPQKDVPLLERVIKIGKALLAVKEIEYFGSTQEGNVFDRMQRLIDRLLSPHEKDWYGEAKSGEVVPRVKNLRITILPDMVEGRISPEERERRWKTLADLYLAQQVSCYVPYDLRDYPSIDRILETVERYEEDLTDDARPHPPLKAIIDVDHPIEVSPERDRKAKVDPLMYELRERLEAMLAELAKESRLLGESGNGRA